MFAIILQTQSPPEKQKMYLEINTTFLFYIKYTTELLSII
jgi:hypothetical protein